MKKAMLFLVHVAALLAILLITVPASAGGCAVAFRQYHAPAKHIQHVEEVVKVVTPTVLAYKVFEIAQYGASFNPYAYPPVVQQAPQYAPPAYAPHLQQPCGEMGAALKAMQAELAALKAQLGKPQSPPTMPPAENGHGNPPPGGDPFNPQPQAQPDNISRILAARCASCHDESRAKASGKGIILLQGGRAKAFTPEELGAVIATVSTKQMPKGIPMPDAERIELIAALASGGK